MRRTLKQQQRKVGHHRPAREAFVEYKGVLLRRTGDYSSKGIYGPQNTVEPIVEVYLPHWLQGHHVTVKDIVYGDFRDDATSKIIDRMIARISR